MEPLSKTIKLGVIVLALELIRELGFSFPRLVRAVAKLLGVSRKAGYKAARRIRKILSEPSMPDDGGPHRELISLRIQNQILTYERDHPGVRFQPHHKHLPPEAKSLCVRLFKQYRTMLPADYIAELIGVPESSLRRWDLEADSHCEFPQKPDLRGQHRRAKPEDVTRVLEEFKALKEPKTLEEFTKSYNEKYPQRPLDRRTITRILQRHGLREVETRKEGAPYHEPFKVYFPGAQVSLDAKEFQVFFKAVPQDVVPVTKEVVIDIASGTVLGDALEKEENSQGVERVILKAREECRGILAVLSDNGSANRSEGVQQLLERDETGQIFSYPAHPQTNGHIEGFFGQFSRIVGRIEVDDTSRQALADCIVEVLVRIFVYFHNHSPRSGLRGLSPLKYLRSYCPRPEEVETAKRGLERQGERSRALREKHARLSDPVFRTLVLGILERYRFGTAQEEALKALLPYDQAVIESAGAAFFVQSQRGGFDKRKRTFAYFVGIVRNKQKEVDEERLRSEIGFQKTAKGIAEAERKRQQVEKEEAKEEELLRVEPERVILDYVDMLLRGRLRFSMERSLERLRRGLHALERLGRATAGTRDRLASIIQSWGDYSEDLKQEALKLFYAEYEAVAG